LGLTALGFAVVEMSYPSGDEFDQGGPNCKRAVADVFKFAMGQKTDDRGRGIGQYCSAPVLTNVVGAVGMSHGGNAIVTTLEEFGEELSGLAFYVSYESPCGTSKDALGDIVLIDYGGVAGDPDPRTDADNNGFPWDDGRSPFYTPAKGLDLARLRWDREASFSSPMMPLQGSGILFLDGNANGKFNVVEEAKNASQPWAFPPIPAPTDTNRNGAVDANEDFELRFHTYRFGGETKRVYSLSVARAAASTVFRSGFPRDIATVEETGEYWRHRDMAAAFDRLGGQFAQLLACIFAGRQDHVQAQWDYPHIRAQYEGLRHAGIGWVRLNPDPVYVRAIADFGNMYLPNNPPNAALSADTMWERTEPVRGPLGAVFVAAAVCELADRVKANNRQHPLESVLFANAPKAAALAPSELLAPEMLKK